MTDILKATYANIITVKTRSVCQLVLELPIEALPDVIGLLGAPIPGSDVWVAVARLRAPDAAPALIEETPKRGSLAQQAGILCGEAAFQRFVAEKMDGVVKGDPLAVAADFVRETCGVLSRSELDTQETAGQRFRDLKADYRIWLSGVEA